MTDWSQLSRGQQNAVRAAAAVELALTATALVQLARRPTGPHPGQIRGSKAAWALGCLVQPIGPVVFLRWGIRRR